MIKLRNLFLCVAICCVFVGEAKIIETASFEDVMPYIQEDCWFLVDLDNTLYEGKQALGHANWFYDELQQRIQAGKTKEEAFSEFYPEWIKSQAICAVQPLEECAVPLIQNFQKQGIVIMGFTHRQPPIAEATLKQVSSLGLDFSLTAPQVAFDSLPASGGPTCYKKGVFFAGDYNQKGEVLSTFLAMSGHRPQRIIFIDDKYKNIQEMEKVLSDEGIDYVGIYYTAIEQKPPIYSRKLAQFQYKYFKQIMSNEAAQCLIDHRLE